MAINLDFGQDYSANQWIGQSSIAQLSQGFVTAYNMLIAKGEKTDVDIKLLQILKPSVGALKTLHRLCNDYGSEDDDEFEVLNVLFYTIPERPIYHSYKPKTEMGRPSISAIMSALANRFNNLAYKYRFRTFRGRGWAWFAVTIDTIDQLNEIFAKQEEEIKDLFIGLSELKKSFVVKIDDDDHDEKSKDSTDKPIKPEWTSAPKSQTLPKPKPLPVVKGEAKPLAPAVRVKPPPKQVKQAVATK